MEKKELRKFGKLILGLIVVVSAIISVLTLTGAQETLRKFLSGLLIVLIGIFGAVSLMDSEVDSKVSSEINSEMGFEMDSDFIQELDYLPAMQGFDLAEDLVEVVRIIDGDTIEIKDGIIIRLIGIDSPEIDECYYREAKDTLKVLILGKSVKLEKDISGTDKFGRLLRYVILPSNNELTDDLLVNNYMVRYGYAEIMNVAPDSRYRSLFISSRKLAIDSEQGMWADCIDEIHNEELGELGEIGDLPIDPNCIIKGNISFKEYGKAYFTPDCSNYKRIKIDFDRGEKYFCTEQEAVDAGFRKSDNCP